jgi:hypothetical protein
VGHRGASANYPENTVLSIEKAIADGAEGVEFGIDIYKTFQCTKITKQTINLLLFFFYKK